MQNWDKFKLTDGDIKLGIDNFFTQILIEAKRKKWGAQTISDLSAKEPRISYVVGQPGAGKTSLGKYILREYNECGECAVEISSDKIATYHRDYEEILKLLPEECYMLTRQFTVPAERIISNKIRDNKINIIREISLTKGEKDYETIKEFNDSGYNVEIDIIAVDKLESFLSCIERDIKLLELGYDPRPVARQNHDRMYEMFLQEIIEIKNRGLCNKVNVYIRGKKPNMPELVYSTGDNTYANALDAVIRERAKNREKILSDPARYIKRLADARDGIIVMVENEELKKNYLEELNNLESEFMKAKAFEIIHQ